MKLLMIFSSSFAYKTSIKTLDNFPDIEEYKKFENVQVAFIQMEEQDENNLDAIEKKLVKNLKWIVKKNNTNIIILHSFAHLSESKAKPEITLDFFNSAQERLVSSGFEVYQTPFGYFLDLDMQAPGFSTARVFKSF